MQKSTETRIDKLLEALKISQLDFANSLNVTSGAITNWKKREMGMNVINKIVNAYPYVSYQWLITGEGNVFKEENDKIKNNEYVIEQKEVTKRINELISESNLSPKMLSDNTSIAIDDFCNKLEGYVPWSIKDINMICSTFRVRKGWLVDGEGQKFMAPDEMLEEIPVIPKEGSDTLRNAADLFTDQALRVEKFIVMLSDEISEVRSLKEELREELGNIRDLKAVLHDAINAFRANDNQASYRPLKAAEDDSNV